MSTRGVAGGSVRDLGHEVYRRTLVTIAVRDYPDAPAAFTSGIDAQLEEIHDWWCGSGAAEPFVREHYGGIATRRHVEEAVHKAGLRTRTAQDVVVVYIVGHGQKGDSGTHYLLLPDTPPDRLTKAYPMADAVLAALDSDAEHVLVIVNSCFSGALRAELGRLRQDLAVERRNLVSLNVFTTADFDQMPGVGDFTELLVRVREWLRSRAGIIGPWLTVDQFETELGEAAKQKPPLVAPQRVWRGLSKDPSPCIPNPGYRPSIDVTGPARRQVADTAATLDYWLDRASGRMSADDPGWYFAGRRDLTAAVAAFLGVGSGLLLVTGAAGTGKSAIIARAVTLSDAQFVADPRYRGALRDAPADTIPPVGAVDVAVLARNKETDDIAEQLLVGLGRQPRTRVGSVSRVQDLRAELGELLLERRRACTIVVDGVDEARQPILLITDLLGPLARLRDDNERPVVRMVVGVRSSTPVPGEGVRDLAGHELLDHLKRFTDAEHYSVLRTDGSTAREAVGEYVDALLAHGDSPYAQAPITRASVADTIARHVAPSFLDGRLAAQRLRGFPVALPATDPAVVRSLTEGTIGLLRQDLIDSARAEHPADELLAVLRASAFAQGAGIPWADIWPAVTAAVADRSLPDADGTIAYLLSSRLSGYLARDEEDGRVVYRPAHELLAEVLRTQPDRLLERPW